MTEQDLNAMEIHDMYQIEKGTYLISILRVPGGWIYTTKKHKGEELSSVFVPRR